MYVLFIILNEPSYLNDILAKFVELGVKGATIVDSQGMASAIVHGQIEDIPLFGSLKNLLNGTNTGPYNKTIFTVLENEELVEKTVISIQGIIENKKKYSAGFMFTIPVAKTYLLRNPNNE